MPRGSWSTDTSDISLIHEKHTPTKGYVYFRSFFLGSVRKRMRSKLTIAFFVDISEQREEASYIIEAELSFRQE